MTEPHKVPRVNSSIDVGVYGCTAAGKTRFLFELLRGWKREGRLLNPSEDCRRFLEVVEGEIARFGGSRGTTAPFDNITVEQVRGEDPNVRSSWKFRDLRGEVLSKELDSITTLEPRANIIPSQVKACHGFLFFFDPRNSENIKTVDQHHKQELRRAERFIEFVLGDRQNRHMPIIFVLTHLDSWEGDGRILEMAQRWEDRIVASLRTFYADHLISHYPAELLDKDKVSVRISSVTGTGIEQVAERLTELVAATEKFAKKDRSRARPFLIAGLLALVVMTFVGVWLNATSGRGGRRDGTSTKSERSIIAGWGDAEVAAKLEELDALLKIHPANGEFPTAEDAEKVGSHLRWMREKISLSRAAGPDTIRLKPDTAEDMKTSLERVAGRVAPIAEDGEGDLSARLAILRAYLEDLPDMTAITPKLGQIQARYWELRRAAAVERLGEVIARRRQAKSPPNETLIELIGALKILEQEMSEDKVSGQENKTKIINELKTSFTFCEDWRKANCYELKCKLADASATNVDPNYRSLRFDPDGQFNKEFILEPQKIGPDAQKYSTKSDDYPLKVGLGDQIVVWLNAYHSDRTWEKLHKFYLPGEPGPLTPLGLSIPKRNQERLIQVLNWKDPKGGNYQLEMEFFDFPASPPLLWDAAELRMRGE